MEPAPEKGWLQEKLKDPEFARLYKRYTEEYEAGIVQGRAEGYRAGLEDAIKDTCMFCDGGSASEQAHPNLAYRIHRMGDSSDDDICLAWKLHARLAALERK